MSIQFSLNAHPKVRVKSKYVYALLPSGITMEVPLLKGLVPEFPMPEWRFLHTEMNPKRLGDLLMSDACGAIVYAGSEEDLEMIRSLPFPVVNLGNRLEHPPIPTISHADTGIGRLAAEHLLELPTRTFLGFGTQDNAYSRRRIDGFVQGLKAAGRVADLHWLDRAEGKGVGRDKNWLSLPLIQSAIVDLPKPLSIFAADQTALVADAVWEAGLRIPEEVRILGVDHHPLTDLYRQPRLSYVKMDFESVGLLAAQSLKGLLAGETVPARQEVPSPGVVAHESTGLLSEEDPWVATACRYIHAHATETIRVEDVVQQVPACRSLLARRFKEETGRSIGAFIRRERLLAAKRLLIDTDLSAEAISEKCGYADPPRLFEAMRKAEGCTPTVYRKRMSGGIF